ncbi:polymer-forming cytoskeletal protein [uncultured Maribacter sp.]|uniref:bactofilin family protein n=1 Tax=uncultured Maribacter sp. TaxID=431308 RepID=UPI0030D6FFA7|tara:strand:- start:6459 stop:6998 length:540 start_codon:yes stop_codon:yes gene_type:complete
MFFSKTKSKAEQTKKPSWVEPTIIAEGATLTGDLICSCDIKVEGAIIGNIVTTGRLIIGKSAKVKGTASCYGSIIQGVFDGKFECAGMVTIQSNASVKGQIYYDEIQIDSGVNLMAELKKKGIDKIKLINTEKGNYFIDKKTQNYKVDKNYNKTAITEKVGTAKASNYDKLDNDNLLWE